MRPPINLLSEEGRIRIGHRIYDRDNIRHVRECVCVRARARQELSITICYTKARRSVRINVYNIVTNRTARQDPLNDNYQVSKLFGVSITRYERFLRYALVPILITSCVAIIIAYFKKRRFSFAARIDTRAAKETARQRRYII